MSLLDTKEYPSEYPPEAVKVLNAMTFTDNASGLKIVGSASLRSQYYAGDYDGYETVTGFTLAGLVKRFKEIVKGLLDDSIHISDIKCGEVEEWRVIPLDKKDFNVGDSTKKIDFLLAENLISSDEADEAKGLLDSYLIAKQEIKFHVVRWTPKDVLAGHVKLRDHSKYTLQDGFTSPSITKLDTIARVKGVYTDFSVIYEFIINGKVINKVPLEPVSSLKESVEYYTATNNPYKAIKRKFALAKLQNNTKDIQKYNTILNSDLGKLYRIYSEVKTMADLLEDTDEPLDEFKTRLKAEGLPADLITDLNKVKTRQDLPILRHIEEAILAHLTKGTKLRGGIIYSPYKDESVFRF
jgi:hypothetical protein